MAGRRTFVDTNVLVYAHDTAELGKHDVARGRLEQLWAERSGSLSTQVLQEFYVVATRKFDPPMRRSDAREVVVAYSAWSLVQIDPELIVAASELEETNALSFRDALIVEAARRSGAATLLTEDLQDGQRFGEVRVVNPFGSGS